VSDVRYLVELAFDEPDDDLGVLGGIAEDACDLIEGHWRVEANVIRGFDRLQAIATQILDEVYPEDIFGGAGTPDSDSSDPGPRLVRALRACIEAQAGGTSSKGLSPADTRKEP
jgi:hypothetical protein